MFGRRAAGFGQKPPSPPPPQSDVWPPFQKMDTALDATIRLFTQAFDQAGHDCGGLAIRGLVPPSVGSLLSDCIVYQGKNGPEYLTLGLTQDFKAFSYQPHCRLFLILNGVGFMEDPISPDLRAQIAVSQLPSPLVEAHMMKRWIKYIRPVGEASAAGDGDALRTILRNIRAETAEVEQQAPQWIAQRIKLRERAEEWCSGFPGTIGRPLSKEVKRINNLPMSDFVADLVTDFLVQMQMRGNMSDRPA